MVEWTSDERDTLLRRVAPDVKLGRNVRLYAFVNSGHPGQGSIRSAISPDGVHFTAEPGIRVDGGQARVVPLDGGGWRLFLHLTWPARLLGL